MKNLLVLLVMVFAFNLSSAQQYNLKLGTLDGTLVSYKKGSTLNITDSLITCKFIVNKKKGTSITSKYKVLASRVVTEDSSRTQTQYKLVRIPEVTGMQNKGLLTITKNGKEDYFTLNSKDEWEDTQNVIIFILKKE